MNGELSGGDDVPAMLSSAPEPCFGSGGIPFVDFDVLVNDAADQRAQAIRDLGRACEDWGFFMVRSKVETLLPAATYSAS
jgi:hypothetical protein